MTDREATRRSLSNATGQRPALVPIPLSGSLTYRHG